MTGSRRAPGPPQRLPGLRLDDREQMADVEAVVELLLLGRREGPLPRLLRELIDTPLFGAAEADLEEDAGRVRGVAAGIQLREAFQQRRANPRRSHLGGLGGHD